MNKRRRVSSLISLLVLWGVLIAIFWCWVFTFLTDTAPENKITLYADVPSCDSRGLALELEKALPDGLRMVQVHPFSYAMFGGDALRKADLFIIRASDLKEHPDWFAPLPAGLRDRAGLYTADGVPVGIPVHDPVSGRTAAGSYLTVCSEAVPDEPLYLCFGSASVHLPGETEAASSLSVAERLLSLE